MAICSYSVVAQDLDSLRSVFEQTEQKDKLNTAKLLFGQYVYYKVDSAIYFAEQISQLAEELGNEKELIQGKKYLGIAYAVKGEFEKAIPFMTENLIYYQAQGDSLNIAYSYNNIGLNYLYAGKNLDAVDNLLEAAKIKDALVNSGLDAADADMGSTLLNIGIAFQNQLDGDQAEFYFREAIEKAALIQNKGLVASARSSLAVLQISKSEYDSAIVNLNSALGVFEPRNDLFALGKVYNNLATAYAGIDKGKEAKESALKALAINRQIGNRLSEGLALGYLGYAELKLGDYTKSILESEKALLIAKELNSDMIFQLAYQNLTSAYEEVRNFKKAYEYATLLAEVRSRVYASDQNAEIEKLNAQYEADKREFQIDQLNKDAQLQDLQLQQSNAQRNLLFVFLVSALIILILALYFYRKLSKSKKELSQLNTTKDKLFSIISHDLKSHITAFQNSGQLINHFIKKKEVEKLERLSLELNKNATNVNHLLDNILKWSIDQQAGYQPRKEQQNVRELISNLTRIYEPLANKKGLILKNEVPADLEVLADKGALMITLRNLMANAIKFTAQGTIEVNASSQEERLHLYIKDSGIGIPEDMLDSLFDLKETKQRIGTDNEQGTGLGLHLANQFAKLNGADLMVTSEVGNGTQFTMVFQA